MIDGKTWWSKGASMRPSGEEHAPKRADGAAPVECEGGCTELEGVCGNSKYDLLCRRSKEHGIILAYALPGVLFLFLLTKAVGLLEKEFFGVERLQHLESGDCQGSRAEHLALYATLSLLMWQVFGFLMIFHRLSRRILALKLLLWSFSLFLCFQTLKLALDIKLTSRKACAMIAAMFSALSLPDLLLAMVKRRWKIGFRAVLIAVLGTCMSTADFMYMFFSMTNSDPLRDVLMSGLVFPLFHVFLRLLFEKFGMEIQLKSQRREVSPEIAPGKAQPQIKAFSVKWTFAEFHIFLEVLISMPGFLALYLIETNKAFTLALLSALSLEFLGVVIGLKAHQTLYRNGNTAVRRTVAARVASWTLGELFSLVFAYATLAVRNPLSLHRLLQALLAEFLADLLKERYCARKGVFLNDERHLFSWKVLVAINISAFGAMWCVFAGIAAPCHV